MAKWQVPLPWPPHLRRPEKFNEDESGLEQTVEPLLYPQVTIYALAHRPDESVSELSSPRRMRRPPSPPPIGV